MMWEGWHHWRGEGCAARVVTCQWRAVTIRRLRFSSDADIVRLTNARIIIIIIIKQFLQLYKQNMERTSILLIQKISFAQFCPAHAGFLGFAHGFNRG